MKDFDTSLLFTHDSSWEKEYVELRRSGKISDGEDKPEEALSPSKTKYSAARKSRYTLPNKRASTKNFKYENREEDAVQLILEKKEIPLREIPLAIIVHGLLRRLSTSARLSKDLFNFIKRSYSVTPSVVMKSDYCEDYWKVVFEKESDVITLDGKNAYFELENNSKVFIQFRRPLLYYQDRNDSRKPLVGETSPPKPEPTLKRKLDNPPQKEKTKSPKLTKHSSPDNISTAKSSGSSKKDRRQSEEKPKLKEPKASSDESPYKSPKKRTLRSPTKPMDVEVDIPFLIDGNPSIRHKAKYSENEEEILAKLTRINGLKTVSRVNFFLVSSHKEGFKTYIECQVLYDRYPELSTATITKQNVTWRNGKITIKS